MNDVQEPKVYIVGTDYEEYYRMFKKFGWSMDYSLEYEVDLVQFTGGSDVDPSLYGHERHSSTQSDIQRDLSEKLIFNHCLKNKIPMAGICRGGQFLNVMCGGTMWQDADFHAVHNGHKICDIQTNDSFSASSTHHQIMIPSDKGNVVLVANESVNRIKMGPKGSNSILKSIGTGVDVESVYYEDQNVFCFQPHPEFKGWNKLAEKYFFYLSTYLNVEADPDKIPF